jgi:hypothetical protein
VSEPAVRVFYRIAQDARASEDDFRSRMERCLPPRTVEVENPGEWAGLSAFDTHAQAAAVSARWRHRGMGAFVAELRIPDVSPVASGIVVRRTFGAGHYTLWGCAAAFLRYVVDTRPAEG